MKWKLVFKVPCRVLYTFQRGSLHRWEALAPSRTPCFPFQMETSCTSQLLQEHLCRRSMLSWKTPPCEMHQASLSQLKFLRSELSVTTWSSLKFSGHYYLFLSGDINKHMIYYELAGEIDIDLERQKRFWKDKSMDFPLRIRIFFFSFLRQRENT